MKGYNYKDCLFDRIGWVLESKVGMSATNSEYNGWEE